MLSDTFGFRAGGTNVHTCANYEMIVNANPTRKGFRMAVCVLHGGVAERSTPRAALPDIAGVVA